MVCLRQPSRHAVKAVKVLLSIRPARPVESSVRSILKLTAAPTPARPPPLLQLPEPPVAVASDTRGSLRNLYSLIADYRPGAAVSLQAALQDTETLQRAISSSGVGLESSCVQFYCHSRPRPHCSK